MLEIKDLNVVLLLVMLFKVDIKCVFVWIVWLKVYYINVLFFSDMVCLSYWILIIIKRFW